jgi:hypothetical protein
LKDTKPKSSANISDADYKYIKKIMSHLSRKSHQTLWDYLTKEQKEYASYLLYKAPFNYYTEEKRHHDELLRAMGLEE